MALGACAGQPPTTPALPRRMSSMNPLLPNESGHPASHKRRRRSKLRRRSNSRSGQEPPRSLLECRLLFEQLEERWLLAADWPHAHENPIDPTTGDVTDDAHVTQVYASLIAQSEDWETTTTTSSDQPTDDDTPPANSAAGDGSSPTLGATEALTTPQAIAPAGSTVYVASEAGSIATSGEVDTILIDVDAGQSITVVADPAAALQPAIELFDPSLTSLGVASSSGAGNDAVLQSVGTTTGGTYQVNLSGLSATTGSYTVEIILNAAAESEEHDGGSNDSFATADDLDGTFVGLGIGAGQRTALLGSLTDGVGTPPSPSAIPSEADLLYNPVTGEVFLDSADSPGGVFHSYVLQTERFPGFIKDNHVPFLFGLTTTTRIELSETSFLSRAGVFNLGAVAPTDMNTAELDTFFTMASYSGQFGTGLGNFDLLVMDVPQAVDHYQFSLNAGESASLVVERQSGGDIGLELFDAAGILLTSGTGADNADAIINDFVAPTTGTYYAKISGNAIDYNFVITRNAVFDAEANDSVIDAQDLGTSGVAIGAIDSGDDFYRFAVNSGDLLAIATATPADGPYAFENLLDPAVELFDASGNAVAFDDNSAPDGRNAAFTHTAATSGLYTIRVTGAAASSGEYELQVSGQTGLATPFEVTTIDPANGETKVAPFTEITVDLSDAVRQETIDAADLTINGTPATAVTIVDSDTLRFTIPTLADGLHNVAIAAGALHDIQNQPLAALASSFTLSTTGPRVISTSVQEGDTLGTGTAAITLQFDRELDAAAIDASDVQLMGSLSGPHSPTLFSYDAVTSTLSLEFADLTDDAYSLTLKSGDGAFEDLLGRDLDGEPLAFPIPANASGNGVVGGDFVVNFVVDQSVLPIGVPLEAVAPLGSQIYDGAVAGRIGTAGDSDAFTIDVDAGQTITVVIDGMPTLQPTVELRHTGGSLVTSAAASVAGEDAVIQAESVTAGSYTIEVSGLASTTGEYQLSVILNALVETESHDGTTNDTLAQAQDLDPHFASLGIPSATNVSVLGTTDANVDFVNSLTQTNTTWFKQDPVFEFSGLPLPAGDALLTITATADLDRELEFLTINAEDLFETNLFMLDGEQGLAVTATLEIPKADLVALMADGTATFEVIPSNSVNELASDELTLELSYPSIPAAADRYQFTLGTGESVSLAATGLAASAFGTGHISLELLDSTGNVLTTGASATNVDQVVGSFVSATGGTYYASVSGNVTDYSLTVARGADFDAETNNALASDSQPQAQYLSTSGTALGGLSPGDVEPGQHFALIQDRLPWSVDSNQFVLSELGHQVSIIPSIDIDTTDLSQFDAIVLASDQEEGTYENVETNIAAIEAFVSAGGVFVVNYAAADLDLPYQYDVLPGASGLSVEAKTSADINVLDNSHGLILGPGGTITNATLDQVLWSRHGHTTLPLPAGGKAILSSEDPSEQVAFEYPLVGGHVLVHTLPIEFFAGGPQPLGRVFHHNLFDYAAQLASDVADNYSVEVVTGDLLNVQTFLPATAGAEFVNELDVALKLYDPTGTLVASDTAGSLTHTAAMSGTYTLRVLGEANTSGEYVVQISGASGSLPAFEVVASDPADGGRVGVDTIKVTVDFSDAVLLTSVTAGDLLVDGSIAATGVTALDHDTLIFEIPALADGLHTLQITGGAILDLQGQSLQAFTSEFTVDTIAPRVIATSILEGDTVSGTTLSYVVQFDEELDASFLGAFSYSLSGVTHGGHVPVGVNYDAPSSTLTLDFVNLPEDNYTLTLFSGDGNFEDLVGNDLDGEPLVPTTVPSGDGEAGGDFLVHFENEFDTISFPTPLAATGPVGSLVHDGNQQGNISQAGDVDAFTLEVDGGQTIAFIVDGDATLQASVVVEDLSGTPVATSTVAAGETAVIQALPTVAGTYTVRVSGAAGSTGNYELHAILNAAVEEEAHGGAANNDVVSAEDIDGSFVELGPGSAARGAVIGQAGSDSDVFKFTVAQDQSVSLALGSQLPGGLSLELLDAGGSVLATGVSTSANNFDQGISNFVATAAGTYHARVSGAISEYNLIVTRGAEFDRESNNNPSGDQAIGDGQTALGYLGGEPAPLPAGDAHSAGDIFSDADNDAGGPVVPSTTGDLSQAAPDRLIVRFDNRPGLDIAAEVAAIGATLIDVLPLINGALVEMPSAAPAGLSSAADGDSLAAPPSLLEMADHWARRPSVLYAVPDYVIEIDQTLPNDLNATALWGMHNTGQTGGTPDADIDAPEAWANFTGTSQVVIASIDTGVDYTHEDLAANMWRNLAELGGTPGVDDDGNGYIDDIYGIDTADDDSDPFDTNGHGTHTAGTFGAVGNNGTGVVGVNWDVQVMALRFLATNGTGLTSDAIQAIEYMTMMKSVYGVNIVASNNSWSSGEFSQPLKDAIAASIDAGIMFVASAGNESTNADKKPDYPAAFDLDGIISVAATDHNDSLAAFSNYGSATVDLGAPGVAIWSTDSGGGYRYNSGTSMAAPHVTGAVAMLMASNPDASLSEIKAAILDGVDLVDSLSGKSVTGGRLNLANSLAILGDAGDYYEIVLNAGDAVQITTSTPAGGPFAFTNTLDPFLEIYDSSGTLVARDDNSDADGINASIDYGADYSGSYTVRVASSGGAGTYIVDVAVAPRVMAVVVNDKPSLGISTIEGVVRGIETIDVQFSTPVDFTPSEVLVQTVTYSGNIETVTDTLTPLAVAGSGTDTMRLSFVAGTVTDTWVRVTLLSSGITSEKNRMLDGDAPVGGSGSGYLAAAVDLPSGDGTAGGNGIFHVGSLLGDVNGDGLIDSYGDIQPTFVGFTGDVGAAGGRTLAQGDTDEDGDVDHADIQVLFSNFYNSLDSLPLLLAPQPLLRHSSATNESGDEVLDPVNKVVTTDDQQQAVDHVHREHVYHEKVEEEPVATSSDSDEHSPVNDEDEDNVDAESDLNENAVDAILEAW